MGNKSKLDNAIRTTLITLGMALRGTWAYGHKERIVTITNETPEDILVTAAIDSEITFSFTFSVSDESSPRKINGTLKEVSNLRNPYRVFGPPAVEESWTIVAAADKEDKDLDLLRTRIFSDAANAVGIPLSDLVMEAVHVSKDAARLTEIFQRISDETQAVRKPAPSPSELGMCGPTHS